MVNDRIIWDWIAIFGWGSIYKFAVKNSNASFNKKKLYVGILCNICLWDDGNE